MIVTSAIVHIINWREATKRQGDLLRYSWFMHICNDGNKTKMVDIYICVYIYIYIYKTNKDIFLRLNLGWIDKFFHELNTESGERTEKVWDTRKNICAWKTDWIKIICDETVQNATLESTGGEKTIKCWYFVRHQSGDKQI